MSPSRRLPLLAASLGVAVGFDKLRDLLPGTSLDHVLAHAHLAVLGWATMMVMAAGYRLLPMILPVAAGRAAVDPDLVLGPPGERRRQALLIT
jgi:hypothetical protein